MNCQLRDNNEENLMQSSSEETWPVDSVDSTQYREKIKGNAKVAGFNQTPKKLTVFSLLTQIAELKKENRMLKKLLIDKNKSPKRARSRLRRLECRSTPLRRTFCKTCTRLLNKGYTTRFCPVHGFNTKINESVLT